MSDAATKTMEGRECHGCGRLVEKFHRVDQAKGFCATCYARLFKKRACPRCGLDARLSNRPDAVCGRCQYDGKPCVRCGKISFEIGKVTCDGPACNSCSPYFRERRPCALCGALSARLSRVNRLGIDEPVCPKCQKLDHACCDACGRHRRLMAAKDGRHLCATCIEQGMVPCGGCGEAMPAGYGKICKTCYFRGLLGKRIDMDCAGFASNGIVSLFREFGQWLEAETGVQKAAISIHRYQQFFTEIENQWRSVPGYKVLLERYGTLGLRRRELPMRFLAKTGRVMIDAAAKTDDANQRQILILLTSFSATSKARALLTGYHDHLQKRLKAGKTSLPSIRLALTPVVGLLREVNVDADRIPSQPDLDRYLNRVPGQRAAISGFVGFLRKSRTVELILLPKVDKEKTLKRTRQALEHELTTMLAARSMMNVHAQKLIGIALAYFHGLPKTAIGKAQRISTEVTPGRSGVTLDIDGLGYWLPAEFVESALTLQRFEAKNTLEPIPRKTEALLPHPPRSARN